MATWSIKEISMKPHVALFLLLLLQACGFAQVSTTVPPSGLDRYSDATVGKISVTSLEQNPDMLRFNRELETYISSELNELFARTGLSRAAAEDRKPGTLSFNMEVEIVYGNRAARYFSYGIGDAGSGSVKTVLRVTDLATEETRYQSLSESKLSLGYMGGSMRSTIKENIQKLMDHYPN
jgi:hypothetical protein